MEEIPIYCRYNDLLDASELKPNPRNPNKHTDEQITRLVYIIRNNGWRNPVVVSNLSGYIVKGHGRLLAGIKIGCKIPVEYQDYETLDKEYADLVADNQIAELDTEALLKCMESVNDISLTGFSQEELDLLTGKGYNFIDDLGNTELKERQELFQKNIAFTFDINDAVYVDKYIKEKGRQKMIDNIVKIAKGGEL